MIVSTDEARALTLRGAYEQFYLPELRSRASPRTLDAYQTALSGWERHSENPPVGRIDNATLARFRDRVLAAGLRPISFNKYWIHMRAILRRIGPPVTGNPLGEGILDRVPYVKALRQEADLPRIATADELEAIHKAAAEMVYPANLEVSPADWWRTLYAVGLAFGPRIHDLKALRCDAFDFESRTLKFRANKTRKWHVLPFGDVVAAHVRRIIGPRPLLFDPAGGPSLDNRKTFYAAWHELQDRAGIREHFGPHGLRRTCGSLYFRQGGHELASYVLGHSLRDVTMRFYIDPSAALRDAADTIDWPPAFRAILDDPAASELSAGLLRSTRSRWVFTISGAAYRGKPLELNPRPLSILRALVAAARPLTVDDLRRIVWRDHPDVSRQAILNRLMTLRMELVAQLGLPERWNPIPHTKPGNGWTLNLPEEETNDAAA